MQLRGRDQFSRRRRECAVQKSLLNNRRVDLSLCSTLCGKSIPLARPRTQPTSIHVARVQTGAFTKGLATRAVKSHRRGSKMRTQRKGGNVPKTVNAATVDHARRSTKSGRTCCRCTGPRKPPVLPLSQRKHTVNTESPTQPDFLTPKQGMMRVAGRDPSASTGTNRTVEHGATPPLACRRSTDTTRTVRNLLSQ